MTKCFNDYFIADRSLAYIFLLGCENAYNFQNRMSVFHVMISRWEKMERHTVSGCGKVVDFYVVNHPRSFHFAGIRVAQLDHLR